MSWLIFAFLSSLTAALVAIFGKLGLKGVDSTLATTIRSLIMASVLLIVSLSLNKFEGFSLRTISGGDWLLIILSGLAGALSWLFYFFALKTGVASKVVAIDRLSLVFVVVLSVLFLKEILSWRLLLGAFLMVLGAILITFR